MCEEVLKDVNEAMTEFCKKYINLMKEMYKNPELRKWCKDYSAYRAVTTHRDLEKLIYDEFMKEVCELPFFVQYLNKADYGRDYVKRMNGSKSELIIGLFVEIRGDYGSNGSLINYSIAEGRIYRLMEAYLLHGKICEKRTKNKDNKLNGVSEIDSSKALLDFIKESVQKYGKLDEFIAEKRNQQKPTNILYFVRFKSMREIEEEWNEEIFEKGDSFFLAFADAYCDIKKGETPKFKKRVNEEKNDKYSFYECKNKYASSIVLLDEGERCFYRFNTETKKWKPDYNLYFEYVGYSSSPNEISEVACTKEELRRMGMDTLRGTRFYE